MIRFFLLQNKQGQRRLSKWYANAPEDKERIKIEADIHRTIVMRDRKYTNFVEYRNIKIVYRKYAGLYFVFGIDETDNELLAMETIHLFVELMDQYFSSVCELDIVFHFNKVYSLLDEFILSGEVQETSKRVILNRMAMLEQQQ
jgi:AP-2 complex subunit sigma-1